VNLDAGTIGKAEEYWSNEVHIEDVERAQRSVDFTGAFEGFPCPASSLKPSKRRPPSPKTSLFD
jgi:hypothetical protein